MVLITGTIKDSAAQPLDAKLTVKLDGSIIDTTPTPNAVLVPEPYEIDIVAGALSIELPESATSNTTYHFLLEKIITTTAYYLVSDGTFWNGDTHQHTDLEYYTGKLQTGESQLLSKVDSEVRSTILDFHAIAPNQSAVEFSNLIHTGISSDVMDTSIRRLAYELTNVQEFVEAIRGGPTFKGPYDALVYYRLNDVVSYNGSSWMWIASNPGVSQTPFEGAYWTLIAAKGDAGGTGGDDTAYDATGWNGVLDAPSKNSVRDIIETLASVSQLSSYAPIASPTFTGTPVAPTPAAGSNSTAIATTAFVAEEFAPINNPILTGNVIVPTPPASSNNTLAVNAAWVRQNVSYRVLTIAYVGSPQSITTSAWQTTIFNIEDFDINGDYNASTGVFTAPRSSLYRFTSSVHVTVTAGSNSLFVGDFVCSDTSRSSKFARFQTSTQSKFGTSGTYLVILTAGQTMKVDVYVSGTSPQIDGGRDSFFCIEELFLDV